MLRYQTSKCPICRQTVERLLEIRIRPRALPPVQTIRSSTPAPTPSPTSAAADADAARADGAEASLTTAGSAAATSGGSSSGSSISGMQAAAAGATGATETAETAGAASSFSSVDQQQQLQQRMSDLSMPSFLLRGADGASDREPAQQTPAGASSTSAGGTVAPANQSSNTLQSFLFGS